MALGEDQVALAEVAQRWCDAAVAQGAHRHGLDETGGSSPWWAEVVAMGWPALHLPTELGGQGCGLPELAVVLEAAGRAGIAGPCSPPPSPPP